MKFFWFPKGYARRGTVCRIGNVFAVCRLHIPRVLTVVTPMAHFR